MKKIKQLVRNLPLIGAPLVNLYVRYEERKFRHSASYWEGRYESGGNSGDGSYGELAEFKARTLNALMEEFEIENVIEFGCGDGNQLTLANYPEYLGLDVSETAIEICRKKFQNDSRMSFSLMDEYKNEQADAALSLDVIFHLVEDPVFHQYMLDLFSAGRKLIVIYASNTNEQDTPKLPHVRHREFAGWVETNQPSWSLKRVIENKIPYNKATGIGSPASFYVYEMLEP